MRGVGIEPTRIAPEALKASTLTTRSSSLKGGGSPSETRTRVTRFKVWGPDRWTNELVK